MSNDPPNNLFLLAQNWYNWDFIQTGCKTLKAGWICLRIGGIKFIPE